VPFVALALVRLRVGVVGVGGGLPVLDERVGVGGGRDG